MKNGTLKTRTKRMNVQNSFILLFPEGGKVVIEASSYWFLARISVTELSCPLSIFVIDISSSLDGWSKSSTTITGV